VGQFQMLRMPENREASSRLAGRMEFEALHTASKMKKQPKAKTLRWNADGPCKHTSDIYRRI
jgi:hypothetical protein